MRVYIYRHDGFLRVYYCRVINRVAKACDECGRNGTLYNYGTLPEDRISGNPEWHTKSFCGVSCMRQHCE